MSLTRVRWLAAVCLSLGITSLAQAQQIAWQPVAGSATPTVIASSNQSPNPAPLVMLGAPIPLAPAAQPARWVAARVPTPGAPIVRGQAPDMDVGSPYPPPIPAPSAGESAGFAPYTAQDTGRFNAPTMPGVVIPQTDPGPPPGADTTQFVSHGESPGVAPEHLSAAVSVGPPHAQTTRTVSATVPAVSAEPEAGTAPPQSDSPDITTHSVGNPPDFVPSPGGAVPAPDISNGVATDGSVAPGFWEKCRDWFTIGDHGTSSGRASFQSDHSFEGMVSPITMPFYFEDPRSLTEIRPIFMYQGIPTKTAAFGGGSAYFFGTQARLAFTERFSVVMSELGFVSLQPSNPINPVQKGSGFSEIKIGPKYTFWRNCATGTVAAGGVNFELPVGNSRTYQNTGSLSLDPYLSFGQTFGRLPSGFGSFNFMTTTGYSLSIDNKRSEFFYSNYHLDYNIANANTFFPLIEMNWIHYTRPGNSNDLGTEGADLFNLGSSSRAGKDYISLAGGLRYRYNEHLQTGFAFQFPISHERGLADYRLTFDVIFRY